MQFQSETSDTKVWSEQELKDLIEYTQYLRLENEELQAKMIMMQAKLDNEEKKTIRLTNMLKAIMYGNNTNDTY